MVEKVLLWGHISGMEILTDIHILKIPLFENDIFSGQSMCVCHQQNSKSSIAEHQIRYSTCVLYEYVN